MRNKYPTIEELVKQRKTTFYSELKRTDLLNATNVLNNEKAFFRQKIKESDISIEQLNEYDDATKSKNAIQTEQVRLFFKGKTERCGLFKPKEVEYDVEINDTMLWGIIGYMSEQKRHFENCVESIDIAIKEITQEIKEVSK